MKFYVTDHAEDQFISRCKITKYKRDRVYDFSNVYDYSCTLTHRDESTNRTRTFNYFVCLRSAAVLCVAQDTNKITTVMTNGTKVLHYYRLYANRMNDLRDKFRLHIAQLRIQEIEQKIGQISA